LNARKAARADSAALCISGSVRNVRKGTWSDECPWRVGGVEAPVATSAPKRLGQTFRILRTDLDEVVPRRIDVGDQKAKGGRRDRR
jgi:hypothetical protein